VAANWGTAVPTATMPTTASIVPAMTAVGLVTMPQPTALTCRTRFLLLVWHVCPTGFATPFPRKEHCTMSNEHARPVHQIRLGRIKASILRNESRYDRAPFFTTTIVRSFRDPDSQEWEDSTSFGRDDLPLVAKAADMAHSWMFTQSQEHNASCDNRSEDSKEADF
jgi:hypothetical protein